VKTVFLGTGAFARVCLRALIEAGFAPSLVVTQPLRRRGRGGALQPTPAQEEALRAGIAVEPAEDVNRPESLARLRAEAADLFVVAEYGQILSQALLGIPRLGAINVHASLLPRYRGATPVAAAILKGDAETGVTIQRVVRKLDAGPLLARRATAIRPEEDCGSLTARLATMGGALVVEVVRAYAEGRPPREEPQAEAEATVCRRFAPADLELDFALSAEELARRVRALHPTPGARTRLLREPPIALRILAARAGPGSGRPGEIQRVGETIDVGTGAGLLSIRELLPENRKAMPAAAFRNGYRVRTGERLGPAPEAAPFSHPPRGG